MRYFYPVLAILLACVSFALGKPERKDPTPKTEQVIPSLAGETNWGLLEQDGRFITISGHPQWYASGYVRKDGKVELVWRLVSTGESCPALYTVRADGSLSGMWGYAKNGVRIDDEGLLVGDDLSGDTTYRVHPAPEID